MANGNDVERLRDTPEMLEVEQDVQIAAPGTFASPDDMDFEETQVEIVEEDDGGVIVDFAPQEEIFIDEGDFYRNLAEDMDDVVLGTMSSDLQGQYEGNKETRKEWMDTYSEGLKLLGFKYEERTEPFRGATGVTHPILA